MEDVDRIRSVETRFWKKETQEAQNRKRIKNIFFLFQNFQEKKIFQFFPSERKKATKAKQMKETLEYELQTFVEHWLQERTNKFVSFLYLEVQSRVSELTLDQIISTIIGAPHKLKTTLVAGKVRGQFKQFIKNQEQFNRLIIWSNDNYLWVFPH